LPFVLAGEEGELLSYFPEAAEAFYRLKSKILAAYVELLQVWADHKDIEEQRDFALAIQGRTPFTFMLFNVRKAYGKAQKAKHLGEEWHKGEAQILKFVLKN
jgi:hypothetical protein